MGQEITKLQFRTTDFEQFVQNLEVETDKLSQLFATNAFQCDHPIGGFELEAWLIGADGLPVPENEKFLKRLANPEIVPELSRFNFEINVQPRALRGKALSRFNQNLAGNWQHCRRVARECDTDVMIIGVHPCIHEHQLTLINMSQSQRYRALNNQILALRQQQPIDIDIKGREHLSLLHNDVMLEAAATSFQIHVQIKQHLAVRAYNIAQIISAPLVALSANSPYVFGVDLCDESRILLFEQSIDLGKQYKKRVCFGDRYIQNSLFNCFKENLVDYPVLLPELQSKNDSQLPHLCLHNGTIWRWNRPLIGFDPKGNPHLRIENRVAPAGPTVLDMMANAAFFWGLLTKLVTESDSIEFEIPFKAAKHNFYAAVKRGLKCKLRWRDNKIHRCSDLLLKECIPLAKEGLEQLGIDKADAKSFISIVEDRVGSQQNGALWQRAWVKKHGKDMRNLSLAYLENQHRGQPVHEWNL